MEWVKRFVVRLVMFLYAGGHVETTKNKPSAGVKVKMISITPEPRERTLRRSHYSSDAKVIEPETVEQPPEPPKRTKFDYSIYQYSKDCNEYHRIRRKFYEGVA